MSMKNIADRNKQLVTKSKLSATDLSFPNRGLQFANEAALYDLIFQSRKPEALAFKDWVTSTVLPALRKDGAYIDGEEKVATGEMHEDELVLKAMGILQKKVERLTAELCRLRHPAHLQPH
jgi:prophage antirepressor-like protein